MTKSQAEVFLKQLRVADANLAKEREKVLKYRKQLSELRDEHRSLKKAHKRSLSSREDWRCKAKRRQKGLKELEKRVSRLEGGSKAKGHHYPIWLVSLVVFFRIYCDCSYGSIVKILQILTLYTEFQLGGQSRLPCRNTVQNWVSKVGYYELKHPDPAALASRGCLILDLSVRVGTSRLLLGLVAPSEKERAEALGYEDVRVVYLGGAESWPGEAIDSALREALTEQGIEVSHVLSDEGNNIKRGVALMGNEHLPDISHALATCLKKTFKQDTAYQAFINDLNKIPAKLAMGQYSYLRPPKQRAKARFMNQGPLINWAEKVLRDFDSLDPKPQQIFAPILTHKPIIKHLKMCLDRAEQVAKPLKTKGLSQETLDEIKAQKKPDSDEKPYLKTFEKHLKKYLDQYQSFIQQPHRKEKSVVVCSDIIERLFGRYKFKASPNFFTGVTQLALELPLICALNKNSKINIKQRLEEVKMTDLVQWARKQSADNQATKRMQFLKN